MIGAQELLVLAAPAALAVGLAAAAGWVGWRLGRSAVPGGWREIERGLRQLLAGRGTPEIDVPEDDPAAPAARLLRDLAREVRERVQRAERKGALLGEAIEACPRLGVAVIDQDLALLSVGENLARILGERPIDLEGGKLEALVDPDGYRELAVRLLDPEARRRGFEVRVRLRRPGHGEVPVRLRGAEIPGRPGRVALVVEPLSGEDGKELARERALALLEGLPTGVLVVAGGIVREANPAARRILGTDPAGRPLRDLLATEELLLALDRVARAERGEGTAPFRARFLGPEGRPGVPVEVTPVPLAGDPRAAALVLADLPRERLVRQGAGGRESRLLAVLDAADEGLVLLAPAGEGFRVAAAGRRAADLLGLSREELSGLDLDAFAARAAARFSDPEAFLALVRGGEGAGPVVLETRDEPVRHVEVAVLPVAEGEGEVGRLVVLRDVTRFREAARRLEEDAGEALRSRERLQEAYEELSRVHRELERRVDELARAKRSLEERERERTELFGEISHELQTPLVSIRGYTQMILEGRLGKINEEQRRGLEVTLRNVDRMVEMIDNLLALARADRGGEPELEEVEVEPVVRGVVERHQGAARARKVELAVRQEAPGARVLAERDGFERVLDNLVGNAIKFNREGGRVELTVRAGRAPGFLEVEVADTGPGIPEDERERIFDRFWRGRTSAGVPGSGIGLATVKSLVERHGGWVAVDSRPGAGARFTFTWPVASAGGKQQATASS